jgi:hypothetical protein
VLVRENPITNEDHEGKRINAPDRGDHPVVGETSPAYPTIVGYFTSYGRCMHIK